MTASSHRLSILSQEEVDDLYAAPRFGDKERQIHFALSPREQEIAATRRGAVGAYFILLLGYFKAKRQFFDVAEKDVEADFQHIIARHFPDVRERLVATPSRPTLLSLQNEILSLFEHRRFDGEARAVLVERLNELAMRSTQPRYLFRETLQYLERERIVLPAYSHLQDIVGEVVSHERNRLTGQLESALTQDVRAHLDDLLKADGYMYRISMLKQDLHDFTYKALRQEVGRRQSFRPLHEFAQQFLATTYISQESSKYYSSLVMYYTVYKLQRMGPAVARLYLLCFAYHRYRQINDHLVEAFLVRVDTYSRNASLASEEAMQKALVEGSENLQAAGEILNLFVDASFPDDAPFSSVKAKAYTFLDKERIPVVANYMRNVAFDKLGYQWNFYTSLSFTFKKNLRHLFIELDFAGRVQHEPLMQAVNFLQEHLRQGHTPRQIDPETFPMEVIPKRLRKYLFILESDESRSRRLDVDRYEFLVYRLLCDAISAGNVYVKESNEYRRFEDDLISDERWKDKDAVLAAIDAPILRMPIQITLDALRMDIEEKFRRVNERIKDRTNAHINVRGKDDRQRWKLVYPAPEETTEDGFYAQLPSIGIADLLGYVAAKTQYIDAFTHVLERYVKQPLDTREILASVVAMGTNMGLGKMAEVARMSYSGLATTARSYLRQETLRAANDAICNATAQLSAFELFNIQNKLHSSSDGQRFETQVDTYKARHSPKYFGLKKGVSVCTVVANHVPINGTVIGAHEHESHFVFDLLFNNTSDIQPEQHSTDTHGTNQINFWILHAFGYRFAPRYRDLRSKTDSLVGFRAPSQYGDALIRPWRKANESLIISEWPNIQRIMASLGQKEVTQSTIIRKLSSYDRQNRTKQALWELDNLYRTLYILDFIDDVELRQSVQKALNRGEAYHRFRRAIAYVNSGKFRVQTEAEQQIWNDCSRLIANAIIYYNTALLSSIYDQKLRAGDLEAIELLKSISPVAWQNVNLFGSFEFSQSVVEIDLHQIASIFGDTAQWGVVESNLETAVFD